VARRFASPSTLGGGLDPIVDGVLLGGVAVGLALGGTFPLWLAAVIVARYLLPALGGLVLISLHRRPELRHTVSGQISTALIIVLVGGICLFRFFNQDAGNVVVGAEVAIPVATVATFLHLAWVARRPVAAPEPG
jgi:phosphatidylglycerophosphate synthase